MLGFAETLYDKLIRKLAHRDKEPGLRPLSPDQRLGLIAKCIGRLKEELKTSPFTNEADEIRFFKEVLPQFMSLFIYYSEKFELDAMRKVGTSKARAEFLEGQNARIDSYYKENSEFIKYYWAGKTDLDRSYFLCKSKANLKYRDVLITVIDPEYCTLYSVKAATLLAYSRLEQEIQRLLSGQPDELGQMNMSDYKLDWTGSKAELIELIYALKEVQVFNNGDVELGNIVRFFETGLSLDLGNVSSTFQKISLRKKGHTHFINRLQDKLDYRMRQVAEGGT